MGDEKGIGTYIETLQKQVDEIKTRSGLTEEQLAAYEKEVAREKEITTQVAHLTQDKHTIKDLELSLTKEIGDMKKVVKESETYLNTQDTRAEFIREFAVVETFSPAIASASATLILAIDTKIKAFNVRLLRIDGQGIGRTMNHQAHERNA